MHRIFSWLRQPEWLFVIIALLAGSLFCFLIPNQAGFDETTHLARIWEISGGYLIPNQKLSQGPNFPAAFADISYRNQYFFNPVDPNFFAVHRNERIDWNVFLNYQTTSSYLPAPYLPQAIAVGLLGRLWNAPVLVIFYTCRALYLLGFIVLTFFAIRLIPFGKWLLTALALAPMTLFQASSVSPDAYTNGACFLFFGWVLRLAFQEKRLNWKQFWITLGITVLLLSVKLDAAFLLPLLLLLVWKGFESKKMLPILVGAVIFLILVLVVGWNLVVYSKFYLNQPGYGISGQLAFIASNPLRFVGIFMRNIASHGLTYLHDWIAAYGYGAGRVPPLTYILFPLVLVAAWIFSPAPQRMNLYSRLILVGTGVVGCILTIMVFYLTLNPVGSPTIGEVLGRHFIPILPILLFGLLPRRELFSRWMALGAPLVVGVGATLALSVYAVGIYLSYYVVCGSSLYTPGLCYQPAYKNWDPNAKFTQAVTMDVSLEQPFTAICSPLRSVRIWSRHASQDPAGATHIVLRNAATNAILVDKSVDNRTASERAWLEVPFPLINNAKGQQFILEITSILTNPSNGLSFGVTERREYLKGIMINNVAADYDLIFQYGCEP